MLRAREMEDKRLDPGHPSALRFYVMTAPVLYFEFNDIAEEAAYLKDHHHARPPWDEKALSQAEALLSLALADSDGKSIDLTSLPMLSYPFLDHPPYFIRERYMLAELRQQMKDDVAGSPNDKGLAIMSLQMSRNVRMLWSSVEPRFLELAESQRKWLREHLRDQPGSPNVLSK